MKLFLPSHFSVTSSLLVTLLDKDPSKMTVAFVPTAADPYEEKSWMDADRYLLKKMGFKIFDLDLKNLEEKELREKIRSVDLVFVGGGNTFYLLEKANKSGFTKVVKELVHNGVIYVGSSAGSIIAGPDIAPVDKMDDPKIANLDSTRGFGFVDFVMLPHYNQEEYRQHRDKIMKKYQDKFKLLLLNDNQVVIVNDGEQRIVEI